MTQLFELYLDELETYGDPQTLVEMKNLVLKIQEKAKVRNSYYLLIKAMILQAKLLLVEGELKSAENLFNETLTLSQEKNLTLLEKEVRNELNHLKEWKIISFDKTTVRDRIQKAQISNYIKEAEKYIGMSNMNLNRK